MGRRSTIDERKLIIFHYENKKSQREIAKLVNKSAATVQHVIERYKKENRIDNKHRASPNKIFTRQEEKWIVQTWKKNPEMSAPKLAIEVENVFGKRVSAETIRRALRKGNLHRTIARKRPLGSNKNKIVQLFPEEHVCVEMGDTKPTPPVSNEEVLTLCKEPDPGTKEFIFQQTMYRIKDPRKTIPFYTGVLGMRLLQKLDFPEMKFSLYFMGFENQDDIQGDLGSHERSCWTFKRKATVELTHNWGTEDDPEFKYHNGNSEPRGYGHIGVMVPDVDKACERFEKLGVNFIKRPQDGKMKTIAFITDPDGYWIEIFNSDTIN